MGPPYGIVWICLWSPIILLFVLWWKPSWIAYPHEKGSSVKNHPKIINVNTRFESDLLLLIKNFFAYPKQHMMYMYLQDWYHLILRKRLKYSETCLNCTLSKMKSCINRTLNSLNIRFLFVQTEYLPFSNTKTGPKDVQFRQV